MAVTRLSLLVERLGGSALPGSGSPDSPDSPGRCGPLGPADPDVDDVHLDSRRVGPGALFAALPGLRLDGASYARDALERGAVAVLSPERVAAVEERASNWVHPEARRVAGEAAAIVHGHPSQDQRVLGITGTNGKSTVAHFAAELLAAAGLRPGLVGTLGVALHGAEPRPSGHTTPDAPELSRLLRENRANGGDAFVLEASSHALDQERLAGIELSVAVFTNLGRDHLDYHRSREAYAAAKERIFDHLRGDGTAVISAADAEAPRMAAAARRRGAAVVTYGTGSRADLCAESIEAGPAGNHLFLKGMGIPRTGLFLPVPGRHNVENALAATAAVLRLGAGSSRVLQGLASISLPPGRLEEIDAPGRGFRVFVDYAHSPDALERVLGALRELLDAEAREPSKPSKPTTKGRLLVLFGCGGERDRRKRPEMGAVATRLADAVFLTSDNPRGEDPAAIVEEILAGVDPAGGEVRVEPDRRKAIGLALGLARPGDILCLAGKGHETWQQLSAKRLPFDDRQVVREELR